MTTIEFKVDDVKTPFNAVLNDDGSVTLTETTPEPSLTDGIRCQWRDDQLDPCTIEAEYVIEFKPMPCGHADRRGLHQRYCRHHFWAKMRKAGTNTWTCKEDDCEREWSVEGRFVSAEGL